MSQALERLQASVAAETSVIASVQTLLTDLSQRVRDANNNDDSEELNTIADEIDQHASELACGGTGQYSGRHLRPRGRAGKPANDRLTVLGDASTQSPASTAALHRGTTRPKRQQRLDRTQRRRS
jgi:hypothetical protein